MMKFDPHWNNASSSSPWILPFSSASFSSTHHTAVQIHVICTVFSFLRTLWSGLLLPFFSDQTVTHTGIWSGTDRMGNRGDRWSATEKYLHYYWKVCNIGLCVGNAETEQARTGIPVRACAFSDWLLHRLANGGADGVCRLPPYPLGGRGAWPKQEFSCCAFLLGSNYYC